MHFAVSQSQELISLMGLMRKKIQGKLIFYIFSGHYVFLIFIMISGLQTFSIRTEQFPRPRGQSRGQE